MKISELLFPEKCPVCGEISDKNDRDDNTHICGSCMERMYFFKDGGNGREKGLACVPSADRIYCYFRYSGIGKEAVRNFKFKGQIWIGEKLSEGFAGMLSEADAFREIICITYVPLSDERFKERGYNQSEIIANILGRVSGKPVLPLISIVKQGKRYSEANLEERKNSGKKYDFTEKYRPYIENKGVMLVDDILTTGATMEECAKGLKSAGAGRVICAGLATGRRDV